MIEKESFYKFIDYLYEHFLVEKSDETNWVYSGFIFDYIYENGIYKDEYFSVEDYFYIKVGMQYDESIDLHQYFNDKSEDKIILFIESIYNLFDKFGDNEKYQSFCNKIIKMLNRNSLNILSDTIYSRIISSNSTKEGYFCVVEFINDFIVRKKLKPHMISDDTISRFKHEYKMMEKLSQNTKFLKVYDYNQETNSYFMDRCDMDLYDYLKENKLDEKRKVELIKQMIDLMDVAYGQKIIHRDLHLGNLLVRGSQLFISDYGLAKDSDVKRSLISSTGPKNDHFFVSPEGMKDIKQVDVRSDIYSIGKIIDYIMGNGILGTNHFLLPVVHKCIMIEKSDRYSDYKSLIHALNNIIDVTTNGQNHLLVLNNIINGECNELEVQFLMDLSEHAIIAKFLVDNHLKNFHTVFNKLQYSLQLNMIDSIAAHFVDATGYGQFQNYDIFGEFAYQIILNGKVQTDILIKAANILKVCAGYRFSFKDKLDSLQLNPKVNNSIFNN